MSLTVSQVQSIFMVLGKGIFLSSLGVTHAAAYESIMVGLVGQTEAGWDAYGSLQSVVIPANTSIKAIIAKVIAAATAAQTINENYLTKEISLLLGLSADAAVSDVLDALRSQVVANGQYITTNGLFDTYIRTTWSYTSIPVTGAHLIPDTYVTDEVLTMTPDFIPMAP